MSDLVQAAARAFVEHGVSWEDARRRFSRAYAEAAVEHTAGNRSQAAVRSGMHRNSLSRNLQLARVDVNSTNERSNAREEYLETPPAFARGGSDPSALLNQPSEKRQGYRQTETTDPQTSPRVVARSIPEWMTYEMWVPLIKHVCHCARTECKVCDGFALWTTPAKLQAPADGTPDTTTSVGEVLRASSRSPEKASL